ncbi:insertion sequence transposase (plasmid) [Rhizobium sp. CCGE 510]|nr:insertion sequence transposase [Rhizobium sp. CCGE 510]
MARALSDDLRSRVLKASAAGMSARQTAGRFGVGVSTAIRWIARAGDGEPTSRPQGWRRPSGLDAHEAFVIEMIDDRKDVTLDEMVGRCRLSSRSPSAGARLAHGCVAAGGRLKKVRTRIGARPAGRPDASASLV